MLVMTGIPGRAKVRATTSGGGDGSDSSDSSRCMRPLLCVQRGLVCDTACLYFLNSHWQDRQLLVTDS